jgi:hypothetical protein
MPAMRALPMFVRSIWEVSLGVEKGGAYEAEEVHEGQDGDDVPVELPPDLTLLFDSPCVGLEVVELLEVMDFARLVDFYVGHFSVCHES